MDKNQPEKGLSNRVRHHAKSIEAVTNLNINDFACKLLTLSFVWAPVAESAMIAAYELYGMHMSPVSATMPKARDEVQVCRLCGTLCTPVDR